MTLVDVPKAKTICRNLVGGLWQSPSSSVSLEIRSPYTGEVIGEVPVSNTADVNAAVAAAHAAFGPWRATPIKERTQVLFRFRELLLRDLDSLANTAALEAGKTREEARAGILKGVEVIEFALGLQNLDSGKAMEVSRGVSCEVRREPLGVVVGIVPFNFPAMVPLWMFPISLTVGNAFILKPSEKVPLTACRMGELMIEAGFPPGIFSLVHGNRETVEALVDHPDVRAVAFVGSSAAARTVYVRATAQGKRALCLGGAKNQLIVASDADEEVTVKGVVDSFTGCAGQRCMAASLMIAVGPADRIVDKIAGRAAQIEIGRGMGAIIERSAMRRIEGAIERAKQQGVNIRLDGRNAPSPAGYESGNWLGPSILDHASFDMECARTEIFGPVLTIVRVKNLDEALAIEKNNAYGNATSVFTTRGAVARYVAEHASSGMVGINIGVPVPREPFSFGGTKDSKFGHGDITGESGVEFWSDLKKVTSKWELQADGNWMS